MGAPRIDLVAVEHERAVTARLEDREPFAVTLPGERGDDSEGATFVFVSSEAGAIEDAGDVRVDAATSGERRGIPRCGERVDVVEHQEGRVSIVERLLGEGAPGGCCERAQSLRRVVTCHHQRDVGLGIGEEVSHPRFLGGVFRERDEDHVQRHATADERRLERELGGELGARGARAGDDEPSLTGAQPREQIDATTTAIDGLAEIEVAELAPGATGEERPRAERFEAALGELVERASERIDDAPTHARADRQFELPAEPVHRGADGHRARCVEVGDLGVLAEHRGDDSVADALAAQLDELERAGCREPEGERNFGFAALHATGICPRIGGRHAPPSLTEIASADVVAGAPLRYDPGMDDRYRDDDASRAIERWGAAHGEMLALRTYTARLLGAESALVLHGGGNTSAKGRRETVTGDEVDVLFIKGSGSDLATIEPTGHPAVRLEGLRRLRALDVLSDEAMVSEQRLLLLDASAPNPSIETLLHAFLPHPFVDHTHADAVLAIADQPDAARIALKIWGEGVVVVPYVMPGFALAKVCAAAFDAHREKADVIILAQHGIFTFGPDARTSYRRMIDAVSRAERYVAGHRSRPRLTTEAASHTQLRRMLAPVLRGALSAAGGPNVLSWDTSPRALAFADDDRVTHHSQIGPATPDHVIRTKPWPALLPRLSETAPLDAMRAAVTRAIAEFGERYQHYVSQGMQARGPRKPLDRAPRLLVVPGIGVVAAGKTKREADVAREIYAHTIDVIDDATAIGEYRPVAPVDLFDLEYWPLEQAKLGKANPRPLDGRVTLVTGGASGIGLATVRRFLAAGAHVVVVDRDATTLAAAVASVGTGDVSRTISVQADVGDEAQVALAFDAAIDAFGGVDVVVSNAGTAPQGFLHEEHGTETLERSLGPNFFGHQHVARAASCVFLAQATPGALLFNASKAAFNPGPGFGPYAVAKAATVALMRQYAIDLGPYGVRANAVNADRIRTALFGDGVLESRAKARGLDPDAYFRANLLNREVTADDVADAFLYLATAESTTGCIVTVDGGNAAAFPR